VEVYIYRHIYTREWLWCCNGFLGFFRSFLFFSTHRFHAQHRFFIIIIHHGGDDYYKCMTVEKIVRAVRITCCKHETHTRHIVALVWLCVGGGSARKKRVSSSFIIIVCYIYIYVCIICNNSVYTCTYIINARPYTRDMRTMYTTRKDKKCTVKPIDGEK